ncbi:hypothetical protein GFL49_04850 [Rhizobium leguminosarum bv. viciae]|nr:hypothetical protein [Rhizobium leguminosarum bv. viciae]NKL33167.1 hypothetical protein [Rhizobium leguminosarum bv. viciae]
MMQCGMADRDLEACAKSEHVIAFRSVKAVEYSHAPKAPRPALRGKCRLARPPLGLCHQRNFK